MNSAFITSNLNSMIFNGTILFGLKTIVGFTLTVVNDFPSHFSTDCHEIVQALFSFLYFKIYLKMFYSLKVSLL